MATYDTDPRRALVGATPRLELFGIVAGGWQLARGALAASQELAKGSGDTAFLSAKLLTARFYADQVLCRANGLCRAVMSGAEPVLAISDDQL